jgi:hypothetical protein
MQVLGQSLASAPSSHVFFFNLCFKNLSVVSLCVPSADEKALLKMEIQSIDTDGI